MRNMFLNCLEILSARLFICERYLITNIFCGRSIAQYVNGIGMALLVVIVTQDP